MFANGRCSPLQTSLLPSYAISQEFLKLLDNDAVTDFLEPRVLRTVVVHKF
jgi:hypothetical protein